MNKIVVEIRNSAGIAIGNINVETMEQVNALKMALSNLPKEMAEFSLIVHSLPAPISTETKFKDLS